MFDVNNRLAIQSWCLRHFKDNREVIERVRELGLRRLELCAAHCDFNNPSSFDDVLGLYRAAGVEIVSIGVEGFGPDEASARKRFDFVRKAGGRVIAAGFHPSTFLAALPVAYRLCDEYGVNLAIHNHGGHHWLGNGEILDWVFSFTRPCIGLCMDTAWALAARQDPLKWAANYAARIYSVHLKDFIFERNGRHKEVVTGTGNLDLPKFLAALKAGGFSGEYVLEYEAEPENPMPALRKCVEAVRQAG